MKYNTLLEYRSYLVQVGLTVSTALTYYKAISKLLSDQYIVDCRLLDVEQVMNKLKAIRHKNEYSKYKNAFIKFCAFQNITLNPDIISEMDSMNNEKKKKYRHLEPVTLEYINNYIKGIKDTRLKQSYKTMLFSGLRVSELSQIRKQDCIIKDNYIEFHFIGKGGDRETTKIIKDKDMKLFDDLIEMISSTDESKKIFYSTNYLQRKTNGFQCHDLRRAFAQVEYQKDKDINRVMTLLRHKKPYTTKIYLKSKVQI